MFIGIDIRDGDNAAKAFDLLEQDMRERGFTKYIRKPDYRFCLDEYGALLIGAPKNAFNCTRITYKLIA